MNRIVHLALKVEDLEKTTEFYQKVFGFREVKFRAPGGTVAELVPAARYMKSNVVDD